MAITASQAQGLVLALFGASAGGHLTGLTGASSLSTLAGDLSTSAGLILGQDLSSNTAFRDLVLTTNLKLTGTALTEAQAWMDGEFTKGTSRADILAAAVTYLEGLTDTTSAFYAAAAAYRTTVADAVTWSQGAGANVLGVTALRSQQGHVEVIPGSSFTLTTATDTFVGTAGNDTFTASGTTYTTGDIISDASATDSDTLNIALTTDNGGTATVLNVENINANLTSFGAVTFDATGVKGAKTVTVNQSQAGSTGVATVSNLAGATNVTAGTGIVDLTVNFAQTGASASAYVGSKGATVNAVGTVSVTNADSTGVTVNIAPNGTTQSVTVAGTGHTTNGVADDAATVVGGGKISVTNTSSGVDKLTLQASGSAATFTLNDATTKVVLTGDQNSTLVVEADEITGKTVTDSTTAGTTTAKVGTAFTVTAGADTVDMSKVGADKIELAVDLKGSGSASAGDNVLVANGSIVVVSATQSFDIKAKGTLASANSLDVSTITLASAAADGSTAYTIAKIDNADAIALHVGEKTTLTTTTSTAVVTADGTEPLTLGSSFAAKSVNAAAMTGAVTSTLSSNLTTLTTGSGKDVITGYAGKMVLDTGAGSDTLKFAVSADLSAVTGASIKGVDILDLTTAGSSDTGSANTNDITVVFAGSQIDATAFAIKGVANTTGGAKDAVNVYMDASSIDLSGWSVDTATVSNVVIDGASNAIANSAATTESLVITATATADTISVGSNGSTVKAGAGADTVTGGSGADNIDGGSGADTIDASGGNDTITGGTGADKITAGSGNDTVNAGDDDDAIDAGSGNDVINGDAGADTISGGAGVDTISGGAGNDLLVGGAGADVLNGGDGYDTFGFASQGTLSVSSGVVTIGGTWVAGEVITLSTSGGVVATYTVKAGDTTANIATALIADTDIAAVSGQPSKVQGDTGVTLTAAASTTLVNTDSGVTVSGAAVTGFDQITQFASAEDTIYLGGSNAVAGSATASATAGVNVQISTGGKVTFAAADDTLAEMVAALVADSTNLADNEVAFFEFDGSTYVYGAGTTADAATDYLIQLVGVTGLTTATISSGSLSFA